MNIIVIIQARMGSTRLPGKVLMSLAKSNVLNYVVSRCKKIKGISKVVVATSTLSEDDVIEKWCQQNKTDCFRGSEENVLERYYECATFYQPDYVIRATSDCPFVDYTLAEATIEAMYNQPGDIVINKQQELLTRGLTIELISYPALKKIYEQATEPRHFEHVTYYAYEYPEQFKYTFMQLPALLLNPNLRVTVDTAEDYSVCTILAEQIPDSIYAPSEEIIRYLLEHPQVASINAHIEQKIVQ